MTCSTYHLVLYLQFVQWILNGYGFDGYYFSTGMMLDSIDNNKYITILNMKQQYIKYIGENVLDDKSIYQWNCMKSVQ